MFSGHEGFCSLKISYKEGYLLGFAEETSKFELCSLVMKVSVFQTKDVGYIENQQQNIADAIDLLPRLATYFVVNIRKSDFEFTPECTIFDMLDIPLYHGWIVDPQLPCRGGV
ncbi:uncharacterized protein LOC133740819 isoform X2 [Rosa rugosa]|uniref:uncharacterized protein LOC133740819 isoform X2 n=1 Tax=Rosa rugosa TaxID=74645 RepID=UPI002B40359E|nr:uncharacterized protein LOC133740819 isoform X2 [Rosa rugosa]